VSSHVCVCELLGDLLFESAMRTRNIVGRDNTERAQPLFYMKDIT